MPPFDADARAKEIANHLDSGNLSEATTALHEEIGKLSFSDYKALVNSVNAQDKKLSGADLVLEENNFGTIVKLTSRNESDTFERRMAIYDSTQKKVARIYEPNQDLRDKFLADQVKDISAKLDGGNFDEASRALNQMLRYDKSLGYGVLLQALNEISKTEKKDVGADLNMSEIRRNLVHDHISGKLMSYQLDGYRVMLKQSKGGDTLTREIGTVDQYTASQTWKPPAILDKELIEQAAKLRNWNGDVPRKIVEK